MDAEPARVLVTGAGGPAAVTLVRSYAQRHDVTLLAADIDAMAVGSYLVPGQRHLVRRGDHRRLVDHVISLCVDRRVEVLIPTVDSELLPLAQEFLPGDEYSIDVLADPAGTVLAAVPRSRLKVDSGISVAGRTHHDPELERTRDAA